MARLGLSMGSAGAEEPRALESGAAAPQFSKGLMQMCKGEKEEAVTFLRIAIDLALFSAPD